MKRLLLFYLQKQPIKPGEFSFSGFVVCWSGIWGDKSIMLAREYVSLYTKTSKENIKSLLFSYPKNTALTTWEKQGRTSDFYMLFFKVINADIQWLTTDKAIASPLSFLSLETSVSLSPRRSPSLINTFYKFPFYEQIHEHLYRLRSLIEHTQESDHAQKVVEREFGLFNKTATSKLPI